MFRCHLILVACLDRYVLMMPGFPILHLIIRGLESWKSELLTRYLIVSGSNTVRILVSTHFNSFSNAARSINIYMSLSPATHASGLCEELCNFVFCSSVSRSSPLPMLFSLRGGGGEKES